MSFVFIGTFFRLTLATITHKWSTYDYTFFA